MGTQFVAPAAPQRVVAIDAYRGLVMFLMMAEVLHLAGVARHYPDSPVWQAIAFNTTHVEWTGCSLHDLIQPSFSFLVGVALPFSVASRMARRQSFGRMLAHALWRSLILVALGVFLRSVGQPQTNFTFEDTLSQIGLGYPFLFLLAFTGMRVQAVALVLILVGYGAAFALYPLPGPDFDFRAVAVPANWPYHFQGLAGHWDKNSNLAWAFDQWFLNLFPRARPFVANGGGYATLSFIPTLGTMILGLLAGGCLRLPVRPAGKLLRFLAAGAACLALGWLLDWSGICPSVKRIWTPAWTLYSGGWCFLILAGFYAVNEMAGLRRWAFPLVVIGANSIAIYCLVHLVDGFILSSIKTHLGQDVFKKAVRKVFEWSGAAYESSLAADYERLAAGAAVLVVLWLVLYWMYRRRIFIKI